MLLHAAMIAFGGLSTQVLMSASISATGLADDPRLSQLVEESLAVRPEIREAEAAARAEGEAALRAGAWADPVLSLGIQNDGFDRIAIGEMETSFWSVGLSQTFAWPGKLGLREGVAALAIDRTRARLDRLKLTTEAEVRRNYVALLLARERILLLAKLEDLWNKSSGLARARYESGDAAQSDVLRAQLELIRLRQRRFALTAQEQNAIRALNRLRGLPLDTPIETSSSLREYTLPQLLPIEAMQADAADRSPELRAARIDVSQAQRAADLARRELFPDFTISAAIMPRGGLEPMWSAGLAVSLPVFAGTKQNRAIDESEARTTGLEASSAATVQLLQVRVAERHVVLSSLLETAALYRDGLLIQSEATAESTVSQYQVGRITFASVLEALAGYLADEESYLASLADIHGIAIASAEISLDPPVVAGAAMGSSAMPGAGAAINRGSAAPAVENTAGSAPSGGGMGM